MMTGTLHHNLILPGDPLFDITLATPPPDWKIKQEMSGDAINYVMDAETGLFRTATTQELEEYFYGGEYDEVMGEGYVELEEEEWLGLI